MVHDNNLFPVSLFLLPLYTAERFRPQASCASAKCRLHSSTELSVGRPALIGYRGMGWNGTVRIKTMLPCVDIYSSKFVGYKRQEVYSAS